MYIQVNGKQIDVGEALRGHVEEHFTAAVQKYAHNPIDCIVTFSKDRHEIICDAVAHISTGLVVKAKGAATDPYAAAAEACDRMEKQLRRYKRRLKDHKQRMADHEPVPAAAYVIDSQPQEEEVAEENPIIIAETKADIMKMSVGDAVMHMEMANESFILFKNEKNGGLNLVFRRPDGNVGWIDPENLSKG